MFLRYKIAILFIFISLSVSFGAVPKQEIRAVWLTTNWGLDWPSVAATNELSREKQKGELCRILDRLKELHINTVFFQTRLRGDLLYASGYEPWSAVLTGQPGKNPGYDPLAFAVEACHQRGLECHAWIVCIPLGSDKQVKSHKNESVVKRHRELCKYFNGEWYLDPGHPGTATYLAALAKEIVSRYAVDGIHLDYIRYPENARRFPDTDTYRKYAVRGESLADWRKANITRIVHTLYDEVRRVSPDVKVSSAPLGKYNTLPSFPSLGWSCIESVYQDPQAWLRDGKQDFIVPMMYYDGHSFYPFLLDWAYHTYGRMVVSGLGAYRLQAKEGDWAVADIMRQLHTGRNYGVSGQSFYRAGSVLCNEKGIMDALASTAYPTPALLPPMPFLGDSHLTAPQTPVMSITADSLLFSWRADSGAKGYVLYGSSDWPVDIETSGNMLAANIRDNRIALPHNLPGAVRYFAVTAVDRYGNESAPAAFNEPYRMDENVRYDRKAHVLHLEKERNFDDIRITDVLGRTLYVGRYAAEIPGIILPPGTYRIGLSGESAQKEKILLTF